MQTAGKCNNKRNYKNKQFNILAMLEKIRVRNYKAFEDASIPIKPITILLGANSVGKSSIVQLMLLLQQTAKQEYKSYKSALKLYGGAVNFGDAKNLFRKLKVEQPLNFSFNLQSEDFGNYLKELKRRFIDSLIESMRFVPFGGDYKFHENREILNDRKLFIIFLNHFNKTFKKKDNEVFAYYIEHCLNREGINTKNGINKSDFLRIYDFLGKISNCIEDDNSFEYNFKIAYNNNRLVVNHFHILHSNKTIISFANDKGNNHLFSDFIVFNVEENFEILKYFDESFTLFNNFKSTEQDSSTIISYLIKILIKSLNHLREEFSESKINYVSPLRAHPKRYYMLDKAKMNITLDTLDGDAIADVLKDVSEVKKSVNQWFGKFNLSINVKEFKEVVHHLKVNQNQLDLDITDVGFGISQVLPVIIQSFLSSNDSTTIIEQPEIHLHPKMQADLADLFIDIVKLKKNG